jgi:hypothetical protein
MWRVNFNFISKGALIPPLVGISLAGAYQSIKFGAANLDYYLVKNTINSWQSEISKEDKSSFLKASKAISNAQYSHPTHPLYRDLQGELLEWGVDVGFLDKESSLNRAKNYYLNAIKLRPTWPVSYAALATIKWRLNQFDQELLEYLNKASRLGPFKAEVHVLFVELGLSLYSANHPFFIQISSDVRKRVGLGLRNHQSRKRVQRAIIATEQQKTVCRWMKREDPLVFETKLNCEL